MAEREYTDYDDWQRSGGNPTYGQGVNTPAPGSPAPMPDNYVDPQIAETERRYNGGSPPAQSLGAGKGWEWNGWDWNQVDGRGLGYTTTPTVDPVIPPPPPPPPPPGPGGGDGAVKPVTGGGAPSAGLPSDILSLFNRQPEKTPVQSAYQDALLKYMKRGQETPSLDDPILGPQAEVYRVAQQRGQERSRRVNAERAAATGQSESGYLDNKINEGVQTQNFNTANFNANLLGQEMSKRRDELQAALQLASATGNAEAERELRNRLAQVSAAMQQQGLNLQGQLGFGDLDLRWALGTEGLNQRALELIMGGTT